MPKALINGVNLYYEVTGQGFPLVWSHEFAGDYQSWDPQVKFFSRRYQVITYSGRGYHPSDIPSDPEAYSQEQVVEDLYGLLQHLGIRQAYIGGLSMGGNVALNFGFAHPEMAKALVVAATGSGTTNREAFQIEGTEVSRRFEEEGMEVMAEEYARDPRGYSTCERTPRAGRSSKMACSSLHYRLGVYLPGHHTQAAHHLCSGGQASRPQRAHVDNNWR